MHLLHTAGQRLHGRLLNPFPQLCTGLFWPVKGSTLDRIYFSGIVNHRISGERLMMLIAVRQLTCHRHPA